MDFYSRISQELTLKFEKNSPFKATFVVHKIMTEENLIEASVIVSSRYQDLPQSLSEKNDCLTLVVLDRSLTSKAIRSFSIDCKQPIIRGFGSQNDLEFETPRFFVASFPSVVGYPFDDVTTLPWFELFSQEGLVTATYSVSKTMPGKTLQLTKDRYNFEIKIVRPILEKAIVVISSLTFIILTAIVTFKLFSNNVNLSGLQELLAVAGYIVAAASFRDLVGVTHTSGTSALEILIFGAPMVALSLGIAFSTWRSTRSVIDKRN